MLIELDLEEARRIAVRAQMLDVQRRHGLVGLVEHLNLLQLDPTAAVAPSADLVAWSRLGNGYHPSQLDEAVRARELFELDAFIRPMSQLPIVLGSLAGWPTHSSHREWLEANDDFRRDLLAALRERGESLSRDLPDTAVVGWRSTGWTHDRNVTQMLEFLTLTGEVAIAGRLGRQRLFDLAERVYPPGLELPDKADALRQREELRLRASGIVRVGGTVVPGEPYQADNAGCPSSSRECPAGGGWILPSSIAPSLAGRRCCHPSSGSSTTGCGRSSCSASSTSWRCTSPQRSDGGATTRCRSSTATGWWASWTPQRIGRPVAWW